MYPLSPQIRPSAASFLLLLGAWELVRTTWEFIQNIIEYYYSPFRNLTHRPAPFPFIYYFRQCLSPKKLFTVHRHRWVPISQPGHLMIINTEVLIK